MSSTDIPIHFEFVLLSALEFGPCDVICTMHWTLLKRGELFLWWLYEQLYCVVWLVIHHCWSVNRVDYLTIFKYSIARSFLNAIRESCILKHVQEHLKILSAAEWMNLAFLLIQSKKASSHVRKHLHNQWVAPIYLYIWNLFYYLPLNLDHVLSSAPCVSACILADGRRVC